MHSVRNVLDGTGFCWYFTCQHRFIDKSYTNGVGPERFRIFRYIWYFFNIYRSAPISYVYPLQMDSVRIIFSFSDWTEICWSAPIVYINPVQMESILCRKFRMDLKLFDFIAKSYTNIFGPLLFCFFIGFENFLSGLLLAPSWNNKFLFPPRSAFIRLLRRRLRALIKDRNQVCVRCVCVCLSRAHSVICCNCSMRILLIWTEM